MLLDAILRAVGELPARQRGRELSARLRAAMRSGVLPAGELLPGSRTLASALGLARGTVVTVLDELADLGLLSVEAQRGYRVAALPVEPAAMPRLPRPREAVRSPGVGDLRLFPRASWAASLRHAMSTLPHTDLGYPEPAGWAPLREALAAYLTRARGAVVAPANIVVVSGVAHAFALLARVAEAAGLRRWYVEDPQPPSIRIQLEHHCQQLVPLPVDAAGAVVTPITAPGIILLTPTHQAPTGRRMSGGRRREFLARTRTLGAMIVEDDYDGELPLARERRTVLQAADPERVILTGSVSKTLAPGLRLGWVCAPVDWADAIAAERGHHDLGSDVIEQAAFTHFLTGGRYERHLRRVRAIYVARRRALLDACAEQGLTPLTRDLNGLQLCFSVAPERIEAARQVCSTGLPAQVVTGLHQSYLVVGTPTITEPEAAAAAARIARAVR